MGNEFLQVLRTWRRQPITAMATLVVLSASLTLVGFMTIMSLNLKQILATWGEKAHLSAYLEDEISPQGLENLRAKIESVPGVRSVDLVTKKQAADSFREQMASYAPDLLGDSEFATPFPASFKVHLVESLNSEGWVERLESLSKTVSSLEGVEDVSYGQSWVRNYSSFFQTISAAGAVVGFVLVFGSLFVIGNSVRASINQRRDEIEILELVGASRESIRRPYIFEGIAIGVMSGLIALAFNFGLYFWQIGLMRSSFAFARMAKEFRFFNLLECVVFLLIATAVGGFAALMTVRSLNDGWAAARRSRGDA